MEDWQVIAVYVMVALLAVFSAIYYGRRARHALKERRDDPLAGNEFRR